jgi:hypothetical protein
MKRIFILLLTIAAACGNADVTPTADSTTVAKSALLDPAAPYYYSKVNGQLILPAARDTDSMCGLTFYAGAGGHVGAGVWPNGIPKGGIRCGVGFLGTGNPLAQLDCDACIGGTCVGGATAWGGVSCAPYSNFEEIASVPETAYAVRQWTVNMGQGPFSGDTQLWDGDAICYLSSFGGMSHHDEGAWIWTQADAGAQHGFRWMLRVTGAGPVSGVATCVRLGRDYETWGIKTAYTGAPANLDIGPTEGFCLLTGVWGNADDGSFNIQPNGPWGQYRLSVSNGIWAAQAQCVRYAAPWN